MELEEAVLGVTKKLEAFEAINLDALRAAVVGLRVAAYERRSTPEGKDLWVRAKNLERELLKIEEARK